MSDGSTTNEHGTVYRFGEYELCPQTHELIRRGERVAIQKRIFCLLVYLVANRNRAVTKEELVDAVWDGNPISETVIPRAIMKARRAIRDERETPRYIRTIRGYGYRFINASEVVPTQDVQSSEPSAVQETDESREPSTLEAPMRDPDQTLLIARSRVQRWFFFVVVISILAIGILIGEHLSFCT